MMRPVFGTEPPTGIKQNSISKNDLFLAYPNPSNDMLNIKLTNDFYQRQNSQHTKIQLLDPLGQLLVDEDLTNQNPRINIQNFPNGIYFLSLKINDQLVQQQKIIIQH
jgi:hypothetical protein